MIHKWQSTNISGYVHQPKTIWVYLVIGVSTKSTVNDHVKGKPMLWVFPILRQTHMLEINMFETIGWGVPHFNTYTSPSNTQPSDISHDISIGIAVLDHGPGPLQKKSDVQWSKLKMF